MVMKKRMKRVTFRVWRDSPRGDDTVHSIRGAKNTMRRILQLKKKGQFNSVMVATGRSVTSEGRINNKERKKLNKAFVMLTRKK